MSVEFDSDAEIFRFTSGPIGKGPTFAQIEEDRRQVIADRIDALIRNAEQTDIRIERLEDRFAAISKVLVEFTDELSDAVRRIKILEEKGMDDGK